jgi:HEAT repeat protein
MISILSVPFSKSIANIFIPDALSYLEEIVNATDVMLASKAVYLASLIKDDKSVSLLENAARSQEPIVRIAVASGLRNLSEQDANRVSDLLVRDKDVGVRKVMVKSISNFSSPVLIDKVQNLSKKDPDKFNRDLASETISKMRQ